MTDKVLWEGWTEAALLGALRRRHEITGNGGGGKYAFLTHVRTGAGFDRQEIDAVVVSLWESEHLDVHAFEVKCSRTDWLREIKPDTYKSVRARELCDTFTIVAPKGVVRDDELPEGWGLLEATIIDLTWGTNIKLRQKVKARPRPDITRTSSPRSLPRGFVVAMLRASGAVPGMTSGYKRKAAARA